MAAAAMVAASLADARPVPYWLDQPQAPEPAPALAGQISADLAVVGGGFTGLWTALLARERDPAADIVLLEAKTAGWAATGRNGGFCSASLTHGLANGMSRFPAEIARLEQLGRQNLDQIEAALSRYGIDCGFERTGELAGSHRPVAARRPARRHGGGSRAWPGRDAAQRGGGSRRGGLADLPRRRLVHRQLRDP
jgi:glycine/D-amino acid oxidase-like deaminating enzyme